jgi:hypothetical protein
MVVSNSISRSVCVADSDAQARSSVSTAWCCSARVGGACRAVSVSNSERKKRMDSSAGGRVVRREISVYTRRVRRGACMGKDMDM